MLTNGYFIEPNPYTKHAEYDKCYLDRLEDNCTKMTKTRKAFGDSDKLDYKLLAVLGGVFCIYFYILSLVAQQCFTFFVTTFVLNKAMALQCQHYAYHLIHFLLAHFFTFASKLLFDKICQLSNYLLTKVCSFVKRKYVRLSSLNCANLYRRLRKCKMRQLLLCKGEKSEDKQALIRLHENKSGKKRKIDSLLKKNFFEHLQLGAYKKIRSSQNLYQKFTNDTFTIKSNYTKTFNTWTVRNFQILTLSEIHYMEFSRTQIGRTQPLSDSPGTSHDQRSADNTVHNNGANVKKIFNSKHPFKRLFNNGLNKKIHPKNITVGFFRNTITKHVKNKRVFHKMKNRGVYFQNIIVSKYIRKLQQGKLTLSKEKRKFKWKKRHKQFVVFKVASKPKKPVKEDGKAAKPDKKKKETVKDQPLQVECMCYKDDYLIDTAEEFDERSEYFKMHYENCVGKATEADKLPKEVLKSLKDQEMGWSLISPTAFGFKHQVKLPLEPLTVNWDKLPNAKLCTCPYTECTCMGNSAVRPASIPTVGMFSVNLPAMVAIQLLHEIGGHYVDGVLRRLAPSPHNTLFPNLQNVVTTKKTVATQRDAESIPAEYCTSACKEFSKKVEKKLVTLNDLGAKKSVFKEPTEVVLVKDEPSVKPKRRRSAKSKRRRARKKGDLESDKSKHPPSTLEGGPEPLEGGPEALEAGVEPTKSKHSPSTSKGALDPTKSKHSPSPSKGGLDPTKSKHSPSNSEGGLVPSKSKHSSADLKDGLEDDLDSLEDESEDEEKSSEDGLEDVIEDSSNERLLEGLQEEEIQGAGEIPLYGKDDNIYERGFLLTTATQTEFDEDGNLLREETDRVKIAYKLRYTTKRDVEGTQIKIEQFKPCAPPHPTRELTLETLLHVPEIKETMSKVKKGIEETLKSLSGTVSSYKRSWRLGVEEMSEHISSYARDLQSRVGIGLGETRGDFSDKSTYTCDMSDDGSTKPKYKRSNSFEKEIYTRPARGLSWPDMTPRMRYDEGNQTDNVAPAKSENEVQSKLEQYLNSLKKEREDKIVSAKSSKRGSCPCCRNSHSEDCLIRTKNTHDFFNTECKPSPTNVEQTDSESSKKRAKCLCHHPKPSKENENNTNNIETDAAKPTDESVVVKSEDNVNTTPNAAANIANEQQESLKVKSEPVTNNADTAKEMPANDSDNLTQISQQKSGKSKSIENITPEVVTEKQNEHIDNLNSDTAKNNADTAEEVSLTISNNVKGTSKQENAEIKSAENITPEVVTEKQNEHLDNLNSDTVKNNADTAEKVPSTISNNVKETSKQKNNEIKSAENITPEVVTEKQNEHLDNLKSDTVKNNADTAEEVPSSISNNVKGTSKQKNDEIKSAENITPEIVTETPIKDQDNLTSDTVKKNPDTAKEEPASVSGNIKGASNQKSVEFKSTENITPEVAPETPIKYQENLNSDTVKENADATKETPAKVSGSVKEIPKKKKSKTKSLENTTPSVVAKKSNKDRKNRFFKQKSSKTKSAENASSEIAVETPNKHPNSLKSETMENNSETAKEAPVNISNGTKRISKQKSIKTKKSKHTSKMVADTPIEHQESIKSNIMKNNPDIAKDESANDPDNVKQISEQNNVMTKSAENTTPGVETETAIKHKDSLEVTPDAEKNDTGTAKDDPASVLDNIKQSSDQRNNKAESPENTSPEVAADTPPKYQDSRESTPNAVNMNADTAKEVPASVPDNIKQTSEEKSNKAESPENISPEVLADTPTKNQDNPEMTPGTDIPKDTSANLPDNMKQSSKQKSGKTKCPCPKKTIRDIVAETPNEHQDNNKLTPDEEKNNTDAVKEAPASVPERMKQKSGKTKCPCPKNTCKAVAKTPNEHQDNLQLTSDLVKNKIDTANEVKSSIAKSAENILSEVAADKPTKHQDSELVPDTVKNNTDIVTEAPADVSDNLKQTSKQKSGKAKCPCPNNITRKVVAEMPNEQQGTSGKEAPENISHTMKRNSEQETGKIKSDENITPEGKIDMPIKHQDGFESDIVKTNEDTATEAPVKVSDSIKQTSEQKTSQTKLTGNITPEVIAETLVIRQDGVEPDVLKINAENAKEVPANVSDTIKQTSEKKNSKAKSAENTTSEGKAEMLNKHQDSVKSGTVKNNADTEKDMPANVTDSLKQIFDHESGKIKSVQNTTPEVVAETPVIHQDGLESDVVKNYADTAKEAPAKVSESIKKTSKRKKRNTKSAENTTSEGKAEMLNKHQDSVKSGTLKNNADTEEDMPANVTDSLKQIFDHESGKIKSVQNTTPEVVAETPVIHQDGLKSDVVKNYADTAKEAPAKVSDSIKQTSKQKKRNTKSVENSTPEFEAKTPNEYQDSVSDTKKTNADEKAPTNVSGTKKRNSKLRKSKIKSHKSASDTEINSKISTNNGINDKDEDKIKDIPDNNSNTVKLTPEQISSTTESIKKLKSQDTTKPLNQDADSKGLDSTIVTPETLPNNEKQSSREVVSKKEDLAKAASDDVVECKKTTCEYYKMKAASDDLVDKDTCEFINSKMVIVKKSAPDDNEYSSECSCCDCDSVSTVCADNCKRSIKNIPEKIAGIEKQKSLDKVSSVRFASEEVVLEFDNAASNEIDNEDDSACFCSDINYVTEDPVNTPFKAVALVASAQRCQLVSSVGFLLDSKMEHNNIACEDIDSKVKNKTMTSLKRSCRDVYGKMEDATWTIPDTVAGTANLSWKSIDYKSSISLKVKLGTVPNIIKRSGGTFNFKEQNLIRSSSDSKLIRTKTVTYPSWAMNCVKITSNESAVRIGNVIDVTKTIIDSPRKPENDNSPATSQEQKAIAINSDGDLTKRLSWPLTKPSIPCDSGGQVTQPITISNGTDVSTVGKLTSLKYCSRYCPHAKKKKKDQHVINVDNGSKTTHDEKAASTKSNSNNIDSKIQDTVKITPDLNENECGVNYKTITTANVVHNATDVKHEEDNYDDTNDKRFEVNSFKTETLLLHKQSKLYYCLKPEMRTDGDMKRVTDNDKNYGNDTTKVTFISTDAKKDGKREYEAIESNLNSAANNERSSVYYRCRRKSKAGVNSATTMDD